MQQIKSLFIITISTIIMAIGVYFFKFPNNFCFGGVTGAAVVFAKILPISASSFSFVVNMALLVVGFAFLGKSFALRTTYATILLSGLLVVFERAFPLKQPLSNEPMLELIFSSRSRLRTIYPAFSSSFTASRFPTDATPENRPCFHEYDSQYPRVYGN